MEGQLLLGFLHAYTFLSKEIVLSANKTKHDLLTNSAWSLRLDRRGETLTFRGKCCQFATRSRVDRHPHVYNALMSAYEQIFQALNEAEVRYVVVGGLATVLHGHARFTLDVDLIVDLEPEAAHRAVDALVDLGFEPRVPVPARDFADTEKRARWIRDKGMRVFSFWSPSDPMTVVDLFVEHPIEFQELWSQAREARLGGTLVRIASIPHLIQLKRDAGRPKDLDDIRKLKKILEAREEP